MVNVYVDESDDGTTYALAGWLTSPTGWNHFAPRWQTMLDTTLMPNGAPMPAFHAAEIVERDNISDSRFKGWTFEQEIAVFTGAIDAIEHQAKNGWLQRVGVSAHIPTSAKWLTNRDTTAWLLLFGRFQYLLFEKYRAQMGFSFVFDNKPSVRAHVNSWLDQTQAHLDQHWPGKFVDESPITFMSDEKALPLQAADLLAYEWRKRSSDRVLKPTKPVRKSYARLKSATNGFLLHYGPEKMAHILSRVEAGENLTTVMWDCETSDE